MVKLNRSSKPNEDNRQTRIAGELLGGLAGTTIALPQSIGLGIALFASMGFDAASGALAGLIGAAAICLLSGLSGATLGIISAPNGPVTMVLTASLAAVAASGIEGEGLLVALALILVLAGLFQVLLGISGGGDLIKYIPYPVVAGMVTSVGILMVLSQVAPLQGSGAETLGDFWMIVPAVTALITIASISIMPKLFPKFPAIIAGLLVGTAAFHLLMLAAPGPIPAPWVVGRVPGVDNIRVTVEFSAFAGLPWGLIVVSALALTVVASVDCLLTALVADEKTGARHNARRELAAQGIGQALAGLLGGTGGGGTKGSTLVAIEAGGRRWAAVVSGLIFVVLMLFLGPVGEWLPISTLAGVIIFVGANMVKWHILVWLRRSVTRADGIVALLVISATLAFDVLVGVGVGVVAAVFLVMRQLGTAPVILVRDTGRERRSLSLRTKQQRELLHEHGDRIVYLELRGHLFFGNVDRLFNELMPDLERPVWMVLNMRRVGYADLSGLNLFGQMTKRISTHGGKMLCSNMSEEVFSRYKVKKMLRWLEPAVKPPKVRTFDSTDAALEYAESALLKELGHDPKQPAARVEFEDNRLFRDMKPHVRDAIKALMRRLSIKRRKIIFNIEDSGDTLYVILQGEVELRLPTADQHYKRIAKIGPGSFFGERTFLHPSKHTTTAIVARDAELLALDRQAINAAGIGAEQYEAALAVLEELAQSLAEQLSWSRAEVRRLQS